jgi:hypothetical protein
VLLVDDVAAKPKAVSWGFWSASEALLDAAVSRTYTQVQVHAAGHQRVLPLGGYRYRVVRRLDLSRLALGLLDGCPGFIVLPAHVQEVQDGADAAETTVDGRLIRSRWAFDSVSRPPPGSTRGWHSPDGTSTVDIRCSTRGRQCCSTSARHRPAAPASSTCCPRTGTGDWSS